MRWSSSFLFLGCWLTRQWQMSRGNFPKPSISVIPSSNVHLGGNFYIYCSCEYFKATFDLYKGESYMRSETSSSHSVDIFFPEAKLEHGGIYYCRYCLYRTCSQLSDGLYINVTASPKPSISVSPGEVIALGGNASIRCKTEEQKKAEFTLHIENSSNTYKIKKMGLGEVLFPITNARESDGGIYRCSYCLKFEFTQACSNYSDELHVKVTVFTGGPPIAMWAGIAASLFLFVLLLLILAFVLCRKRKKGSMANERTQPANIPLQAEPEEDPDGVSYAVLSHNSVKTKPVPDVNSLPETCVYATVAQHRRKESQ